MPLILVLVRITGRVLYLGLELTMHVLKSRIHLVRQSL
jgi:hypothetical protein